MSNTRFGPVNNIGDATIGNGDGTAPARTEVAPHVMERTQNGDRRGICVVGAPNQGSGTTWEFNFTFSGARTFSMAAALSVEHTGITTIECGIYSTYASVKSAAGNLVRNGRDWGLSFANKTGQHWYFNHVGTGLVSIGGFFLGPVSDLGVVGLPDFTTDPFRIRNEQPQVDGSIVLNDSGRMGHEFQMEFFARDLTELAKYQALVDVGGSFILLDDIDCCFEVLLVGGRIRRRRRYRGYGVTLSMMRMP